MDTRDSLFLPHGGYRKLRSYKVAEAVYDATVVFCRRFYPGDRRMSDQMVQAARSGVRNISEGSGAAATSRKSEMKLTNVARASLSDELLRDYESFLVQNGLRVWPKDSREALAMRARLARDHAPDLQPAPSGGVRLRGLTGLSEFVERAAPELAANAMVCVVNQAAYLLKRQLESQGQTFVESGGFTEKLYGARRQGRSSDVSYKSDKSYKPDQPPGPPCPSCGHPMVQRIARKSPKPNQPFWGCSTYPDCKATLAVSPSDKPDQSDVRSMNGGQDRPIL
jgi:four helix bundle suffix protein